MSFPNKGNDFRNMVKFEIKIIFLWKKLKWLITVVEWQFTVIECSWMTIYCSSMTCYCRKTFRMGVWVFEKINILTIFQNWNIQNDLKWVSKTEPMI